MPGCSPVCVSGIENISGWSDRDKWEYVRQCFSPYPFYPYPYTSDPRQPDPVTGDPDPSRELDEDTRDALFTQELQEYTTYSGSQINVGKVPDGFEFWLRWKYRHGTSLANSYANLPEYTRSNHSGHCWVPCPYSTQAYDTTAPQGTQDISTAMLRQYFVLDETNATTVDPNTGLDVPLYDSNGNRYFSTALPANHNGAALGVDHTDENGRVHLMKTQNRGSSWGFECTFSGCSYLLTHGVRYFHT